MSYFAEVCLYIINSC